MQNRRYWEKALALDPGSAPLNAMLAVSHFSDARHGWTGEDRDSALKKAEAYVARALEIDPQNPEAYRALGGILMLKSRFEEAASAVRKAAKFGPSLSDVLAFGAFVLCCSGGAAEAVSQIEKAIALGPNYPSWYLGVLGNAYRLSGRADQAKAAFRAYHEREPGYGLADIVMIQEQAGHVDDARKTAARLAELRPTFTVTLYLNTQFRHDIEQLAADVASLRAAGVREQ